MISNITLCTNFIKINYQVHYDNKLVDTSHCDRKEN